MREEEKIKIVVNYCFCGKAIKNRANFERHYKKCRKEFEKRPPVRK